MSAEIPPPKSTEVPKWPFTTTAIEVLFCLASRPRSIRAVSRTLGCHRTTIRKELDTLTEAGWIEEAANDGPHRIHRLTHEGRQAVEKFMEFLSDWPPSGSESDQVSVDI